MTLITDIDDLRVKDFKEMKKLTISGYYNNCFIADGEKVVLKLLKSELRIIRLFALREFIESNDIKIREKIPDSEIYFADKKLFSEIIGFKVHTGVMALAEIPSYSNLHDLSDKIICLNKIIDAENVGAISRNTLGFGIDSIIIDRQTCSPYLRRSVRVSMGSAFKIKYCLSDNLIEDLLNLKAMGYKILCAENNQSSHYLSHYKFPEKFCLIFGNETHGIDNEILNLCDDVIEIKIENSIDSLNVTSACGIFLNSLYTQINERNYVLEH